MKFLFPDWPVPSGISAAVSLRGGGVSHGVYRGCNLAQHVGDDADNVMHNRQELIAALRLPLEPCWLTQVHSANWVRVGRDSVATREVDASLTSEVGRPCAVLTADCLSVLFCTRDGAQCGVAHAGWRGLLAGVLARAPEMFGVPVKDLLAWIGPAIGPCHYEVSEDLRRRFLDASIVDNVRIQREQAFRRGRSQHWFADLFKLARIELETVGIEAIYGGGLCTYCNPDSFYSYRRDGTTGRFATVIWRDPISSRGISPTCT